MLNYIQEDMNDSWRPSYRLSNSQNFNKSLSHLQRNPEQ